MDTDAYAYNYDPIGNRQSAKLNDDTTSYAANALNQYATITEGAPVSPTYDFDGNMLTTLTHAFAWDAENRLITASNLTGGVVASYTYDHQSRRIYKTVVNSSILSYISLFTYDGWNLIQEVSTNLTSSTISTNLYVWGLDLSGSLQGAGGVGGLLSVCNCSVGSQNQYYPLADANGNITEYINTNGTVVAHYEYDAFGNTSASSGTMDDDFVFRFSSKYLDAETGFYYYGYRYLDPPTGRWLSRDPIGIKGGLNEVGFVGNDAVYYVDTIGAEWFPKNSSRLGTIWKSGPVSKLTASSSNNRQVFADMDNAAAEAGNKFSPSTVKSGNEWGGHVCRSCRDGEWVYYTTAAEGTDQGMDFSKAADCDKGDDKVGAWHTHSYPSHPIFYLTDDEGNEYLDAAGCADFSKSDRSYADSWEQPLYLTTPYLTGRWNPNNETTGYFWDGDWIVIQ